MKIIVGLGNPGKKYKNNRHNLGYRIIDNLSRSLDVPVDRKRFNSLFGKKDLLLLLKPTTFMNDSGRAVVSWLNYYKTGLDDLLVVYDDSSIGPGYIRFRPSGSDGGHNGLKSIISCLGTNQFPRLRIGIGQPPEEEYKMDLADYVLADFSPEEEGLVEKTIECAAVAVKDFIENDIQQSMNKYNKKSLEELQGIK